jgi:hypothetical protein
MDKTAFALAIIGIAGVAVIAYILLTRGAYAAPPPQVQPTPPDVEILDYEVY